MADKGGDNEGQWRTERSFYSFLDIPSDDHCLITRFFINIVFEKLRKNEFRKIPTCFLSQQKNREIPRGNMVSN